MTKTPYDPRVDSVLRARGAGRPRALDIDEDGEIHAGAGQREAGGIVDAREIPFPELEHYGFDHGNNTMRLAEVIAFRQGVTRAMDLEAVCIAGMFHDVGRLAPFGQPDAQHNIRSADAAKQYMQRKSLPTELIDIALWLIGNHDLSKTVAPTDPRLQALWDADLLEGARYKPGTGEGLKVWRSRKSRCVTPFGRDEDNQKIWMRTRGWSK